jgi:hypothetical protein
MAKVPPAGRAMARFIARTLRGVKPAPFPGFIEPCKPRLKPKLPVGDKWQFEIKLDGYRTQLHLRGDRLPCSPAADLIGRTSSRPLPRPRYSFQQIMP